MKIRIHIIIWLVVLAACSPTKDTPRNDQRVSAWMMANPGKAGRKCTQMFPVTDSTDRNSSIKPGVPVLIPSDSAIFDPYIMYDLWLAYTRNHLGDSLSNAILQVLIDSFKSHPIKAPCPPHSRTTDTMEKYYYIRVRDRALEASLVDSIDRQGKRLVNAEADVDEQRKWKRFWMWAFIIVAAYTIIRWIIKAQWPALGKVLP